MNVLIQFSHGLGDAIQLTPVLQHLQKHHPDWDLHLDALWGKHSVGYGYCKCVWHDRGERPDMDCFNQVFKLAWPEGDYATKADKCLRQVFGLVPEWDLMRYKVHPCNEARSRVNEYLKTLPLDRGYVCLHYEGNTSPDWKNLSHHQALEICEYFRLHQIPVVLLDWDRRSNLPDEKAVFCPGVGNPLWLGADTGDAATVSALAERCRLFIGVDSGPQKCALASGCPTLCVWTKHHPVNYCDNAPNAVHVVPHNHADNVKIGKLPETFKDRYRVVEYRDLTPTVIRECQKMLIENEPNIGLVAAYKSYLGVTAGDRVGAALLTLTQVLVELGGE